MALVIEDGTARPDSQSYSSVVFFREYCALRGIEVPDDEGECEILLTKAMDRMEAERDNYQGERVSRTQALSMPRVGMCVDGWDIPSNEIPRNALYAQCAFAAEARTIDLQPTTKANAPGPITSQTVGPITTVYANPGSVNRTPAVAKAEVLLRTLLKRNGLFAVRA